VLPGSATLLLRLYNCVEAQCARAIKHSVRLARNTRLGYDADMANDSEKVDQRERLRLTQLSHGAG
jgi:hypothetical protein